VNGAKSGQIRRELKRQHSLTRTGLLTAPASRMDRKSECGNKATRAIPAMIATHLILRSSKSETIGNCGCMARGRTSNTSRASRARSRPKNGPQARTAKHGAKCEAIRTCLHPVRVLSHERVCCGRCRRRPRSISSASLRRHSGCGPRPRAYSSRNSPQGAIVGPGSGGAVLYSSMALTRATYPEPRLWCVPLAGAL
jgi:hypothetical protein